MTLIGTVSMILMTPIVLLACTLLVLALFDKRDTLTGARCSRVHPSHIMLDYVDIIRHSLSSSLSLSLSLAASSPLESSSKMVSSSWICGPQPQPLDGSGPLSWPRRSRLTICGKCVPCALSTIPQERERESERGARFCLGISASPGETTAATAAAGPAGCVDLKNRMANAPYRRQRAVSIGPLLRSAHLLIVQSVLFAAAQAHSSGVCGVSARQPAPHEGLLLIDAAPPLGTHRRPRRATSNWHAKFPYSPPIRVPVWSACLSACLTVQQCAILAAISRHKRAQAQELTHTHTNSQRHR